MLVGVGFGVAGNMARLPRSGKETNWYMQILYFKIDLSQKEFHMKAIKSDWEMG